MSTPNTPEEPPRFGQRSPNWSAEQPQSDPGDTTPWGQYGTRSGQPSGTPWPKYGETSQPSGAPQQGHQQDPRGAQGQGWQQGPQAWQQGQPGPQGWQQPYPGPVATPDLPSRAGAVVLIVLGVVVATVIAFATAIGVALAGMNFQELVNSATPVASGDTVSVDTSGSYMVADSQGGSLSCGLRSSDGTTVELETMSGYSSMVMGSNIPAGTYTLECQTTGNASLVAMSGVDASQMTSAVMRGFAWGTVLGVLGIAMVIGGIIWLVRINGRRSALQRQSWQMGAGRY